jgi:hypothetical protein
LQLLFAQHLTLLFSKADYFWLLPCQLRWPQYPTFRDNFIGYADTAEAPKYTSAVLQGINKLSL